jgi:hypothetical protein
MAGFGLLAQGMARANDKRNAMARQQEMDERQREQDARTQEMAAIQQAALLASLDEKGISRGGDGTPIGQTGFRQDPTMTRRARELAAQRQRQEMLTRRRAVLQARGVNPDEIDVENDDIYESYAKFQKPEAPQAPVRGTPEYLKALDAEEGVRARHRPAPRPRENRMPSQIVEKEIGVDNMVSQATDVQKALAAAVKSGTDVTGRAGGLVSTPNWLKNANLGIVGPKGGQTGIDTRQAIGSLKATIAKERAGTSMTPG